MSEDERKVLDNLLESRIDTNKLIQKIIKWIVIAFISVSICLTIIVIVTSVCWANTLQSGTNDYFYSDYGYGTVEQSVTQRVEQEVK